jgi:hypothetical protein
LCICVFVYLCIYSGHLGLGITDGKRMANGQVGGSPSSRALARSCAANLKIETGLLTPGH